MRDKSSTKAGALYLFASIFNKGIGFLTIPLFTRLLTTSEYGIVTTYSAWAAILTAFIGMQLNCGIRLSRRKDCSIKIDKNIELSTIFTFTFVTAVIWLFVIYLFLFFFHIKIDFGLIILCFFEGLFNALITDYTYFQMMEGKYVGRTILMILPNLVAAVLSVILILIFSSEKALGRIVSLSGAHVFFGLLVCVLVFRNSKPIINKSYIKWSLKVSLPLVLHGVALNILSQADRTMITALRDSEETGIYGLIYSFSMIATVITTGLEGIWIPWFTKKLNEKKYKDINAMSRNYIHLMTYAIGGLVLISPEILKLLAPSEYWKGIMLIPPLVVSNFVIFAYTMYVNVEYYYEKTLFITINTIIAAGLNILLNFLFIPQYGYMAAAYTTLVSYLFSFVLHAKYAKQLNDIVLPIRQYGIPLLHIILITVVFCITVDNFLIRWVVCFAYIIGMFVFERKRIGTLIPYLSEHFTFFK